MLDDEARLLSAIETLKTQKIPECSNKIAFSRYSNSYSSKTEDLFFPQGLTVLFSLCQKKLSKKLWSIWFLKLEFGLTECANTFDHQN